MTRLFVLALILIFPAMKPARGEVVSVEAKVLAVVDGCTLEVSREGRRERFELAWIECPEIHQPAGPDAKQFTLARVEGRTIRCLVIGRSSGGLDQVRVLLPESRDLAEELLAAGLARVRTGMADDARLRRHELEARLAKRGIWAEVPSTRSNLLGDAPVPSRDCVPRSRCCKVCTTGKACGASCISRGYNCHKGRGCACNSYEVCS